MKKVITMFLAITLIITAVAPSNKANAEEAVGTAPADTVTQAPGTAPADTVTQAPGTASTELETGNGNINVGGHTVHSGDMESLTKGFKTKLSIRMRVVQWTSSRPDIASVDANGNVTAKKYGETTITVVYAGSEKSYKDEVIIKVVKNEYKRELNMIEVEGENGKKIGTRGAGITSMKFDSKGNLKCVFSAMDKFNKRGMKLLKKDNSMALYKMHWDTGGGGSELAIKNDKGKVVLRTKITNSDKDNFCCKGKLIDWKDYTGKDEGFCRVRGIFAYKRGLNNKPRNITFTVKKKYLKKMKNVDLRTCRVAFDSSIFH